MSKGKRIISRELPKPRWKISKESKRKVAKNKSTRRVP
jgi:hypothetical protein